MVLCVGSEFFYVSDECSRGHCPPDEVLLMPGRAVLCEGVYGDQAHVRMMD